MNIYITYVQNRSEAVIFFRILKTTEKMNETPDKLKKHKNKIPC